MVVLLRGQQEGQEVQRVGVVPLQLESLADVAQSLWNLEGNRPPTNGDGCRFQS